jgi:hypothetical protein
MPSESSQMISGIVAMPCTGTGHQAGPVHQVAQDQPVPDADNEPGPSLNVQSLIAAGDSASTPASGAPPLAAGEEQEQRDRRQKNGPEGVAEADRGGEEADGQREQALRKARQV